MIRDGDSHYLTRKLDEPAIIVDFEPLKGEESRRILIDDPVDLGFKAWLEMHGLKPFFPQDKPNRLLLVMEYSWDAAFLYKRIEDILNALRDFKKALTGKPRISKIGLYQSGDQDDLDSFDDEHDLQEETVEMTRRELAENLTGVYAPDFAPRKKEDVEAERVKRIMA